MFLSIDIVVPTFVVLYNFRAYILTYIYVYSVSYVLGDDYYNPWNLRHAQRKIVSWCFKNYHNTFSFFFFCSLQLHISNKILTGKELLFVYWSTYVIMLYNTTIFVIVFVWNTQSEGGTWKNDAIIISSWSVNQLRSIYNRVVQKFNILTRI